MAQDSGGKVEGLESSAIGLLTRAVEMDGKRHFTEALVCYQEGLKLLLDVVKATHEEKKKQHMRQKVVEYMDRAEKLKDFIEKEKLAGNYHEQTHIEANSIGHSYEKVFGRFLDDYVLIVEVEDPYVRSTHQIYNLLRFSELLYKSCKNLKKIKLLTGYDEMQHEQQKNKLDDLGTSLAKYGVQLEITYSTTLHDREIRLSNGWIFKIGRGLDIFKAPEGKFSLGYCDFDLRPCHETTVDIFHKKVLK